MLDYCRKALKRGHLLWRHFRQYSQLNRWHKFLVIAAATLTIALAGMFSVSRWYIWSERAQPVTLGTSFVADYATYLGLDPHQTFLAILDDLQVKHVRLVSYWSDIEATPKAYDFSELDWEFEQANQHGAKVSLAIGLRQPRWPECHMPDWALHEPRSQWQPQLEQFMTAVINRYRQNPALESYQLENEYFLTAFATCADQSRDRLIAEATLVKQLDPYHQLIISRSQNALGWPINQPIPDQVAISIYRRVWQPLVHRYMQYPFPAWYYAFLAGMEKIWTGKDTMIHELQTEPWPPDGTSILTASLDQQNDSLDAARLTQTVDFAKRTGMKTIDLWGSEYWYYRATKLHDPSVWNTARSIFNDN